MECPGCDGGIVVGKLMMPVEAPLNRKGGGLALAGIGVKQSDIKTKWEELETTEREIACNSCGAEFSYVPGTGIIPKGDGEIGEEEASSPAPTKLAVNPRAAAVARPVVRASVNPRAVASPRVAVPVPGRVAAPQRVILKR